MTHAPTGLHTDLLSDLLVFKLYVCILQCLMYVGEMPAVVMKRRHVLKCLQALFANVDGLIVPLPFIHKPGFTRGTLMIEVSCVAF
jgi:hypothetical protein